MISSQVIPIVILFWKIFEGIEKSIYISSTKHQIIKIIVDYILLIKKKRTNQQNKKIIKTKQNQKTGKLKKSQEILKG